jgi:hypothetical protein
MKFDAKTLVIIGLVLALLFILFGPASTKSKYMYAPPLAGQTDYAPANLAGTNIKLTTNCAAKSGVGLASSLLPRELATQDDFGQFAPDDILAGQNFLDPRSQIGWPETIGGTLRNGNQQERAEPPNPKQAYVWNNSTIVPDLMQRNLCT